MAWKYKRKTPKTEREKLVAKLDRIFSKYIRMRDADTDGNIRCCTCGKLVEWKRSDCGHFHNRRHMAIRWDEQNCNAQCRKCNRFEEGEKDRYLEFMEFNYGQETLDRLALLKRIGRKWSVFELEAMIALYKDEVKKLEGRL